MLGSLLLKELLRTPCSNDDSSTVSMLLLTLESLVGEVGSADKGSVLF